MPEFWSRVNTMTARPSTFFILWLSTERAGAWCSSSGCMMRSSHLFNSTLHMVQFGLRAMLIGCSLRQTNGLAIVWLVKGHTFLKHDCACMSSSTDLLFCADLGHAFVIPSSCWVRLPCAWSPSPRNKLHFCVSPHCCKSIFSPSNCGNLIFWMPPQHWLQHVVDSAS